MMANITCMSRTNIGAAGIFAAALLLGSWCGGAFDGYSLRYGLVKSFAAEDVKELMGKSVTDVCVQNTHERTTSGKVVGHRREGVFFTRLLILSENGAITGYPKDYFQGCMRVVEE